MLLRHQLTLLQRQVSVRPRTTWADRALVALLLEVVPKRRRAQMRLLVTPETVLRRQRDIVRRRWAAKSSSPGVVEADAGHARDRPRGAGGLAGVDPLAVSA